MPETKGGKHRIPVAECEITATITLSDEQGISALYCGSEKKIHTYIFDADRWTMDAAKEWVQNHSRQAEAETLGRMGGPEAGGPGGMCVCPECGHRLEHDTGQPCYEITCPQCGAKMTRDVGTEEQETLGRHGGPEAGGPGGVCVCPQCGHEIEHETDKPCDEIECPQCGTMMTRKPEEEVHEQSLPALSLSLPTVLRIASGEIGHFNHIGELTLPPLTPVNLVSDGVAYAKVALSTPSDVGENTFMYNVKVLEVYSQPFSVSDSDIQEEAAFREGSIDLTPPVAAQKAAALGLELRGKFNRGGTEIGVARARDISNGKNLSPETIRRMVSYFARHEVDKKAEGWGNKSNPSAGYIAWLLWGGDPGRAWADRMNAKLDKLNEVAEVLPDIDSVLDERVSWRLPPFSNVGGAYFLAPIVRDLFPAHDTFVEPFAGASNVLFSKLPVETEVLNDTDAELIQAYEDIRALTLEQLIELKNRNWFPWQRGFDNLRENNPTDVVDRLYRFLYLSWYSFDSNRKDYRGRPKNWNLEARMGRIENARVRLREVKMTSEDGIACINKWDSPTTAFFIDPPFDSDIGAVREALSNIKGKFVLRASDTPANRDLLAGYGVMSSAAVKRAGQAASWQDGEVVRERAELLVTNCKVDTH
jgi:hypothetical protein